LPGELFSAFDQQPQCLQFAIGIEHSQVLGADGDDRDRVRVVRVGLAIVSGVEQPCSGRQLRGHVDYVLAIGEQPLGQRAPGAVAALDRPDPIGPGGHVLAHRGVAGLVGGEPTSRQRRLVVIDHLDGRRQPMGIDPDEHLRHEHPLSVVSDENGEVGIATTSRAVPSAATPHHGARRGRRPEESHTDRAGGQPQESDPTKHLDRVWPDAGPDGID
jgi:hypothetical protein